MTAPTVTGTAPDSPDLTAVTTDDATAARVLAARGRARLDLLDPTAGDVSLPTTRLTHRPSLESTPRNMLDGPARRAVLTAHIAAAGAWICIDIVLGMLAMTTLLTTDADIEAMAYRALDLFVVWPLLAASLLTLTTGIMLGLGTDHGLLRYWWVAVKLAMNLVLVVLVVLVAFVLRPAITDAPAHGETLGGTPGILDTTGPLLPPIVSLAALGLSVYRPWDRIHRRYEDATLDGGDAGRGAGHGQAMYGG